MTKAEPAEQLVRDLLDCQRRLDAFASPIAAAHVDSAIEAFCRERGLNRDTAGMD